MRVNIIGEIDHFQKLASFHERAQLSLKWFRSIRTWQQRSRNGQFFPNKDQSIKYFCSDFQGGPSFKSDQQTKQNGYEKAFNFMGWS